MQTPAQRDRPQGGPHLLLRLKVEPGTKLWTYKDCANLPDDDAQADMYFYAVETLEQFGYHQYEISNFAKDGLHLPAQHEILTGDEYLKLACVRRPISRESALRSRRISKSIWRAF